MTFSQGEINAIMRDENDMNTVLSRDYCSTIHPTLRNNYHNVKSALVFAPGRYTSEFAVRIANLRPAEFALRKDFWPSNFETHTNFLRLVKSILITQFANTRTCVDINFSISLIILDDEDPFNPAGTFLWSSRSNNLCLDQAFLIESLSSLNYFVDNVVSQFSVENYLLKSLESLENKYNGVIVPITTNFYITLNTATVFGASERRVTRSLSDNNCANSGKCDKGNNCVWRALSALMTLDEEQWPVLRNSARKRTNQKIARRLKARFLQWYRHNYGNDNFVEPVSNLGYDSRLLHVLEKFLGVGIVLVEQVKLIKKKVSFYGLVDTTKVARCLKVKFASRKRCPNTIFLASDGQCHIRSVTNLPTFAYKYICKTCSKSYRYDHELKKHRCKDVKFRGSVVHKWNCSLSVAIERAFGMENVLKSDTKFMHVLINGLESGGDVSVTMCFSLLGGDYMTKTVSVPDLRCASQVVTTNCTKAALLVLGERLKNNYSLLKRVENDYQSVSIKSDPVKVENLIKVKKGLVAFLSSFACYIQVGCNANLTTNDVMHSFLATLSNNYDCGSFGVRFGKNVIQGLAVKGSPVKYVSLAEFSTQFRESEARYSHVTEWANTIEKFEQHFGLNITGLSLGQMGHELLANCLTNVEQRMFLTSPVAFQKKTYDVNVRYGLLCFEGPSVLTQETDFKSVASLDYSRFYFHILCNPEEKISVGLPIHYKQDERDKVFVAERNRRRKTVANVFLKVIEVVLDTTVVSMHNSHEVRFDGRPVDGYFSLGDDAFIVEIQGCAIHGLKSGDSDDDDDMSIHNGICHLPKNVIDAEHPGHMQSCDVCIANSSGEYSYVRPKLWRLRAHETVDSVHFYDKKRTYGDIYESTRQKIKSIKDAGFEVIDVWECDILKFWTRPVEDFFARWKLLVNEAYKNVPLGKLMAEICTQTFPLSLHPYLTESQVLKYIKDGTLNGYATVSCKFGPMSQALLGNVKPFFMRGKNGDAYQTFDIDEKCIPVSLLSELLNNASFKDFQVTRVYDFFEYAIARKNPFARLMGPVLGALNTEGSSLFSKVLKISLNGQIGCWNYNPLRHKKSLLINETDIAHLNSRANLSHCTRVNEDKVLMHVKNDNPVSNLSHLHLNILGIGVAQMLRLITGMINYYGCAVSRINTDGVIVKFEEQHPLKSLCELKKYSLIFDSFLVRTDSGVQFLKNYLDWKKCYFKHLGVCPSHEQFYLECLASQNVSFSPSDCCKSYINTSAKYPLLVEFVGNIGIFKSINSLILANTMDKCVFVKGSGLRHLSIDDLTNKSVEDLTLLL